MRKFSIIFVLLALFFIPALAEENYEDLLMEEIFMRDNFEVMYAEGMVLVDGYLRVREKPFDDSKIVGRRFHGDMVFVTGKCNGYYKIDDHQYVHENYVYLTEEYSSTSVFCLDNMKYLRLKYLGRIETGTYASSITRTNSLRFEGEIPLYDIVDGYAYFPRGKKDIFKIPVEVFSEIIPAGEDYELLASYRTTYETKGSSASRAHNIELASSSIDGIVINPGKTFSFNGTTGPRYGSRGYQQAPAFQGEETVLDYGGGVCQVSSTIFSAVRQCTGIAITERRVHSQRVSYLPEELEATVSYDHIDFKFLNEYDFPVMLTVNADNGVLLVKLWKLE